MPIRLNVPDEKRSIVDRHQSGTYREKDTLHIAPQESENQNITYKYIIRKNNYNFADRIR